MTWPEGILGGDRTYAWVCIGTAPFKKGEAAWMFDRTRVPCARAALMGDAADGITEVPPTV